MEPSLQTDPIPDPSSVSREPESNDRMLIVEDSPSMQRILRAILGAMNLKAEMVENGRMACERVEKTKAEGKSYDLILMDIHMPVMDGYEATRRLRKMGFAGPIVALTAHTLREDIKKCLGAGCNDYMSKPVDRESFVELVAKHVRPRPNFQSANAKEAVAGG